MSEVALNIEEIPDSMTADQTLEFFRRQLGRNPELYDLYEISKDLFNAGAYNRAVATLRAYLQLPGSLISGHHLIGYCYLKLNQRKEAIIHFKKCVKQYPEDWQLLVELAIEQSKI